MAMAMANHVMTCFKLPVEGGNNAVLVDWEKVYKTWNALGFVDENEEA